MHLIEVQNITGGILFVNAAHVITARAVVSKTGEDIHAVFELTGNIHAIGFLAFADDCEDPNGLLASLLAGELNEHTGGDR